VNSQAQSQRISSRVRSWKLVHIGLAATVFAAVLTAALLPQWGSHRGDAQSTWSLAPSVSRPPTDMERFVGEMKLHEALTDASFGLLVTERDLQADIASAVAEHEALVERWFPETVQASADKTEVERAIAEHHALTEAFAP
jgi:hypothetical protein